jgi:hypothetical protein
LFLGFPSPAVGHFCQGKQVSEIASINKNRRLNGELRLLLCWCPLLNVETLNHPIPLNKVSQLAIPVPLQQRLVVDPALQNLLGQLRSVAKTTHPIVIES